MGNYYVPSLCCDSHKLVNSWHSIVLLIFFIVFFSVIVLNTELSHLHHLTLGSKASNETAYKICFEGRGFSIVENWLFWGLKLLFRVKWMHSPSYRWREFIRYFPLYFSEELNMGEMARNCVCKAGSSARTSILGTARFWEGSHR